MEHDDTFTETRRALHGVAELLLAGPQHAASGKITLRSLPGGFGTTHSPDVRVDGTAVVAGDHRAEIDGRTPRDLAALLGLEPSTLGHVYRDGSGVQLDDTLHVDAGAAERIAHAYATGDEALRSFASDQVPILWPEHFDIGIAMEGRRVNLGVSPGDATIPVPYMYVGPWDSRPVDDFWNQPFGAARELGSSTAEVVAFFTEAFDRLSG